MERVEKINDVIVTVTHVYSKNQELSFHVTSFMEVIDNKITALDEYWADDGAAPKWRLDRHIGKKIK